MREIKFRVWEFNHMNYHPSHEPGDMQVTLINEYFKEQVESFGAVYMQYTGLKDKNGKEIYEGDIILIGNEKSRVTFDDGCFCICGYLGDGRTYPIRNFLFSDKEIEVIGNIYEDPELLGDQKVLK